MHFVGFGKSGGKDAWRSRDHCYISKQMAKKPNSGSAYGDKMPVYVVKWIIEGEMRVESESVDAAENSAQQTLVSVLADETKWPAALGVKGIQGAAERAEEAS